MDIVPIKKTDRKTKERKFHRKIISRWGTRGFYYHIMRQRIRELVQKFGIRHMTTPRYNAQANSTERSNRSIKTTLKAYLENHNLWDVDILKMFNLL